MLGDIENCHGDIKGVGNQKDRHPHFDEVFEETERIPFMQIVLLGDHRYQLIAEHESNNHPCNGDDHGLRKRADHAENIAVPSLGGLTNLFGDGGSLLVDIGKHGGEIALHQANEKLTDRLLDLVKQTQHG